MLPAGENDNITINGESIIETMWESRQLATHWASKACIRDFFCILFTGCYMSFIVPVALCVVFFLLGVVVILCDMCMCVFSYCSTMSLGKNRFAVWNK
jgi:hypothetical protein